MQGLHPPFEGELAGGVGGAELQPGDPGGGADGHHETGALGAHDRQHGASDVHRAKQKRLDLIADLLGA